jgi:translation initiation factor 5A
MWEQVEVRELKPNRFMVIDDEPCKIISIDISKPGKHGEAKARIVAFGLFDNVKRSVVHPVTHKVRVPMIDRRRAQVLNLVGESEVNLMDMETFETFHLSLDEEFRGQLRPGQEISYVSALDRKKLVKP